MSVLLSKVRGLLSMVRELLCKVHVLLSKVPGLTMFPFLLTN